MPWFENALRTGGSWGFGAFGAAGAGADRGYRDVVEPTGEAIGEGLEYGYEKTIKPFGRFIP